jgi:chemotaxis protein methyltransferase CheR
MEELLFKKLKVFFEDNFGYTIDNRAKFDNVFNSLKIGHNIPSDAEYVDLIHDVNHAGYAFELISHIANNYTFFYRERHSFDYFEKTIIPNILLTNTTDIRVGSFGCSTGEEPYSIAMSLDKVVADKTINTNLFACDISPFSIKKAREGIYSKDHVEYLTPYELGNYFSIVNDSYIIKDFIKNNVVFVRFNILSDHTFKEQFHCIFVRNVLLYFNDDNKKKAIKKLVGYLGVGGYLIFSVTEIHDLDNKEMKRVSAGIYRKVSNEEN